MPLDDALAVLDEIGNRIVAAIASEIEVAERNRAILKPPGSLDAWEAYHRGLWHMYRFNGATTRRRQHFFRWRPHDPTFARAHAGLSFTHFQNAFLHLTAAAREHESRARSRRLGERLVADDRDPAAHWAMGRALWLRGGPGRLAGELDRASS